VVINRPTLGLVQTGQKTHRLRRRGFFFDVSSPT
jgi:hypothetical protein